MAGTRVDGRVERGNQTRRLVLRRTMDIASVEGLEGLSLGRIAGELGLSKSGVFALFGSKEELQLATVRAAGAVFAKAVVVPVQDRPPGVGRLLALCAHWLRYSRERVFPGGCFFYGAAAEFASRSGPVHDAVAAAHRDWAAYVARTAEEARTAGELRPETDPAGLAFELIALLEHANLLSLLHGAPDAYDLAATAVVTRLRAAAADPDSVPDALPG
ncbi:TetR/AcrR family transcriptional regulator [Streptomyces sp. WMMC500]|uniref:TetR/AcrR family transcriptional regulator n=1 Tax=Streptomyces sp. WMMC500 TaxID=3015154 RepID=UPI00248C7A70|nr:TetR/AcrR family transcriptional regulator [Streptomyces sp. WMMC500]WBB60657.1 TetR/AcrR family transcriptional regulator [Streptomyces sp. WMMC500]